MILKQNCHCTTSAERHALEEGNYISPKQTTFTGSSVQRQIKNNDIFSLNDKKEIIFLCNKEREERARKRKLKKNAEPIEHSLSFRSKSKIRQKLIAWSNCIPKRQSVKFSFITLTLTSNQNANDRQFTKMQNTLFTYLRKHIEVHKSPFSFKNYLYVLEKQKNGNIHSHIILSSYIPVALINRAWCKILTDNGYTYDQKGKIVTPMEGLRNYAKDKSLGCPSPVDIRAVFDFKKVSSYITKYITKNETKIKTQIWNCSQSISRLWTGARIDASKYLLYFERFTGKVFKKAMENGGDLIVSMLTQYTGLQKKIFQNVNMQYLFPITNGNDSLQLVTHVNHL